MVYFPAKVRVQRKMFGLSKNKKIDIKDRFLLMGDDVIAMDMVMTVQCSGVGNGASVMIDYLDDQRKEQRLYVLPPQSFDSNKCENARGELYKEINDIIQRYLAGIQAGKSKWDQFDALDRNGALGGDGSYIRYSIGTKRPGLEHSQIFIFCFTALLGTLLLAAFLFFIVRTLKEGPPPIKGVIIVLIGPTLVLLLFGVFFAFPILGLIALRRRRIVRKSLESLSQDPKTSLLRLCDMLEKAGKYGQTKDFSRICEALKRTSSLIQEGEFRLCMELLPQMLDNVLQANNISNKRHEELSTKYREQRLSERRYTDDLGKILIRYGTEAERSEWDLLEKQLDKAWDDLMARVRDISSRLAH